MAIKSAIIFPIKFNTLIKNNFDKKQLIAQCTIPVSLFFLGGRGHWAVYYTSPQSFYSYFFLSVGSTTLGICMNF